MSGTDNEIDVDQKVDEQLDEQLKEQPTEQAAAGAEAGIDADAQSDATGAAAPLSVEDLQAQLGAAQDQVLRAQAEMENVRKRSEREVEKARKFALERFAQDLLAVADNLEMGIDAANQEAATLESVKEGSELTLKTLVGVLERFGIKQLSPEGEKFNPEFHEAMVMQPAPDAEPNTVLTVVQKGYVLNERVIRPARVIVAAAA